MIELPVPSGEELIVNKQKEWQSNNTHDASRAFATWTFLVSKNAPPSRPIYIDDDFRQVVRQHRFFMEQLTPVQYHELFTTVVDLNFKDACNGSPSPPLNERAHLPVLVLDVDEGNRDISEITYVLRLIQNVFAVHFGIETDAIVAMRLSDSGETRYHLYFPHVLAFHSSLWYAVSVIVNRMCAGMGERVQYDDTPVINRCIRLHGTNRDEAECRGGGIYRFVVGYDRAFVRMLQHPQLSSFSVRPSAATLWQWMFHYEAYGQVRTNEARNLYNEWPGEHLCSAAVEAVRAAYENWNFSVLQADRRAQWFLCATNVYCGAHRERCQSRVLCRLATVGGIVYVYRWRGCAGHAGWLVADSTVSARITQETYDCTRAWPRLSRHDRALTQRTYRSIMTLPLELFYKPGFTNVEWDQLTNKYLWAEAIGGSARRALCSYTPVDYARMLLPYSPQLNAPSQWTESSQQLTMAQCGADRDRDIRARLMQGVVIPPVNAMTHLILMVEAPCGTGKTFMAFSLVQRAQRILFVAPRKALCNELSARTKAFLQNAFSTKRVVLYSELADRAHAANACDVLVVTPESLPTLTCRGLSSAYNFDADLVIVDEFCTVLKTVYTSDATTTRNRVDIERAILSSLSLAKKVLVMDKDIGFFEHLFVGAALVHMHTMLWPARAGDIFSGVAPPVHVHMVTLSDEVRMTINMYDSTLSMDMAIMHSVRYRRERVAVFHANAIEAYRLQHQGVSSGVKTKLLAGTVNEDDKREFSQHPDEVLEREDTQMWVYTSAANVGISVERHEFDRVCVQLGSHLTFRDALQAERRVRAIRGQSQFDREIDMCMGNTSTSLRPLASMPTIGTAMAEEQKRTASAAIVRTNTAHYHNIQIDGAVELHDDYRTILQVTCRAIAEFERRLQSAHMAHWVVDNDVDVVYHSDDLDDLEKKEELQIMSDARKEGALKRTHDELLAPENDDVTRLTKTRRLQVLLPDDDQLVERAAANEDFVKWQKHFGIPCIKVWRALLLTENAGVAEAREARDAALTVGVPGGGSTAVALLANACLRIMGAQAILEGQVVQRMTYDSTVQVVSPFDGSTVIGVDEFFGKLAAAGSLAASNQPAFASPTLLRCFTKPYVDDGPGSRLKIAKRIAQALLGGKSVWYNPMRPIYCLKNYAKNVPIRLPAAIPADPWGFGQVQSE